MALPYPYTQPFVFRADRKHLKKLGFSEESIREITLFLSRHKDSSEHNDTQDKTQQMKGK